ncbi:signal transducing adapter molecule 1 [Osmia bicornis bicornis]|uniref:signal transducing adapter molecule 1 n=1 Tax=Osmia bicornis bicornis TaxID=1437191 RepID=UPI0010F787F1|nr:signal transducing adapter molecule 1 [Osmia bicornis bicornis]XP_034181749.1 signal transducing adapter molecule 1 [Osmia lignaria]
MGLFQTSSPFDADVEKATSEKNISEEWGKIMDICDKVGTSTQHAKDCLRSIVKRLGSPDPHIVMQALILLDACVSNCGKPFHLEIASREFENDLRKLINHSQPKIADRTKGFLKKWAEGDFKTDPQLNLIPSLYNKLKNEGYDFSCVSDMPKRTSILSKDPNVVTNSQEEEDIAKAIELSLKETKAQNQVSCSHSSPASKKNTSLYPNVNAAFGGSSNSEGRKVRALYDFEAAEDNELTFLAGEIINILDDSDPNWWKGSNNRGEGLFPSNFVTADLSMEPEQFTKLEHSNKKMVQFAEEVEVKTVKREPEVIEVEIDERKMDRLLHLLHEADPQCDTSDSQEMLELEEQVTAMGPLIDAALEKVDRRHAQLTQLSSDLVDALNLYHTLMREPPPPTPSNYTLPKMSPHINPYQFQNQGPPPPPQHIYNGVPPPHQSFPVGGGPSGPYNTNIPTSEYMGPASMPNMMLSQHYHVPPTGPHQHSSGHPQGLPVPEQSNLHYSHQGYPPQSGPLPGSYGPSGPTGPPVSQQPQYAPPNGQRMM